MKNSMFLWAVAATMTLIACSKESGIETQGNSSPIVKFTAGIQTRAKDTSWSPNDSIGIYMKKKGVPLNATSISENVDNFKYTTNGDGKFNATPENMAYFPVDGSAVDFIAYYPYKANITSYTYPINVVQQTNQESLDIMYSNNALNMTKGSPIVNLIFNHKLSNIIVNLTAGSGLEDGALSGVQIKLTGQKTIATMDLSTDTIIPSGEANQDIELKMSSVKGEAIILPAPETSGRKLIMKISTGEEFVWTIPTIRDFKSGHQYIYNITLNRTGVENVTTTINPWIAGNDGGSNESAN